MQIKSSLVWRGKEYDFVYNEGDPMEGIEGKVLEAVHAFCFCNGKLVLVKHPHGGWMPPGGAIEPGETYEQAVVREVKEETNMKVVYQELIGYQDGVQPTRTVRQTRSFCVVEPYGPFVPDRNEEIQEIILIDPKDYKKYMDWGVIGDHLMTRAMEMYAKSTSKDSRHG